MAAGIETRHARSCRQRDGRRCNCEPTYRANVWDGTGQKRIRHTFASLAEAQRWRKDARVALRRGRDVTGPNRTTLEVASREWLDQARAGAVRNRSGDIYKPSAIRSYEQMLRLRVWPALGAEPLADVGHADLQELVDAMTASGAAAATVVTAITPLRAIFRREVSRGRLKVNPAAGLDMPAVRGGRDRIADPKEGEALLAAVPDDDRAVWATAMYAGLRRGEIRALHVDRIDLDGGLIHVERGWDDIEGEIATKGGSVRRVPIASALREPLAAHLLRSGRRGRDLAFGETAESPFNPRGLSERADTAWTEAKLHRITLHECRHTFASLMIAAGVNAKALSTYMGHANIAITMDRYGHLMPGNEEQAAGLLDQYLERAIGGEGG